MIRHKFVPRFCGRICRASVVLQLCFGLLAGTALPRQSNAQDPDEPLQGRPKPTLLPRPGGEIPRSNIDEESMRTLIHQMVSCGTRLSISSWADSQRGIGCGRDQVVARLRAIAADSGG